MAATAILDFHFLLPVFRFFVEARWVAASAKLLWESVNLFGNKNRLREIQDGRRRHLEFCSKLHLECIFRRARQSASASQVSTKSVHK
jgi:hypothetical protein